jgi:aminoglycoside phosphotransferase (APT) family kinase protein
MSGTRQGSGYAPVPVPPSVELGDVGNIIQPWLANRMPHAEDIRVTSVSSPAEIGGANETYLFDAQWREGPLVSLGSFVLKMEPADYRLFLDPKFDAAIELLRVLDDRPAIPTPRLCWAENDTTHLGSRFYVMTRVGGRVPSAAPSYAEAGWLATASGQQQEQLWRSVIGTMALIHTTPLDRCRFVADVRPGQSGVGEQLEYWTRALEWVTESRRHQLPETTLHWLMDHLPDSDESATGLSWGDARIRNMLFEQWQVSAVLDWDLTSLAGPLADLGYLLYYDYRKMHWDRLAGVGDRRSAIALWEELSGRSAANVLWFEAFAGLRLMIQRIRKNNLLRQRGVLAPDDHGIDEDNEYTRIVEEVLREAS